MSSHESIANEDSLTESISYSIARSIGSSVDRPVWNSIRDSIESVELEKTPVLDSTWCLVEDSLFGSMQRAVDDSIQSSIQWAKTHTK